METTNQNATRRRRRPEDAAEATAGATAQAAEKGGGEAAFFDRLEEAEDPHGNVEESYEADIEAIRRMHGEVDERIGAFAAVRLSMLRLIQQEGNIAASELWDRCGWDRETREELESVVKEYYRDSANYLNNEYGTDFEAREIRPEETKPSFEGRSARSRRSVSVEGVEDARSQVAEPKAIVALAVKLASKRGGGLEDAGRQRIIDEMSNIGGRFGKTPTVGKSYIHFKRLLRVDDDFGPPCLNYGERERANKIRRAVHLFNTGRTASSAPFRVLGWLTFASSTFPSSWVGQKVPALLSHGFKQADFAGRGPIPSPEEVCQKGGRLTHMKLYQNGSVRLFFDSPEDTRAFAELFGF